jgi:hypothetical protein
MRSHTQPIRMRRYAESPLRVKRTAHPAYAILRSRYAESRTSETTPFEEHTPVSGAGGACLSERGPTPSADTAQKSPAPPSVPTGQPSPSPSAWLTVAITPVKRWTRSPLQRRKTRRAKGLRVALSTECPRISVSNSVLAGGGGDPHFLAVRPVAHMGSPTKSRVETRFPAPFSEAL